VSLRPLEFAGKLVPELAMAARDHLAGGECGVAYKSAQAYRMTGFSPFLFCFTLLVISK
jgi:hypothetical protein